GDAMRDICSVIHEDGILPSQFESDWSEIPSSSNHDYLGHSSRSNVEDVVETFLQQLRRLSYASSDHSEEVMFDARDVTGPFQGAIFRTIPNDSFTM
ncbi:hypothetical protein PMAYCL1PPCAC_17809, partial [Pristionchus mayeri]